MAVLTAREVAYAYQTRYQTVQAVAGVSAEFEQGLVYAITGPSGSGKTTFLSLLAGLDVPNAGVIEYGGKSMASLDRDLYRLDHVSVIYQSYNLFYHLTVLENAAYPLYLRKTPRQEADAAAREQLLAIGLQESQFRRLPNTLSGGEQQRVAIARALTAGSEIVLADEPTGNLDSTNTENIMDILRTLAHDKGRCVIIVTHDPYVAERADVVLRMRDGALSSVERRDKEQ